MYVFIKAMLFKEIVMRDYLEQAYEVIRDQCKKYWDPQEHIVGLLQCYC